MQIHIHSYPPHLSLDKSEYTTSLPFTLFFFHLSFQPRNHINMTRRHPSFPLLRGSAPPHQSPAPTDKYLSHFLVLLPQTVVMNSTVTILIFDSVSLVYIFRSGIAGAQGKQVPPQSSYEPSKATYGGVWFPSTKQSPPLWTKGQKCLEEAPTRVLLSIRKTEHLPYLG